VPVESPFEHDLDLVANVAGVAGLPDGMKLTTEPQMPSRVLSHQKQSQSTVKVKFLRRARSSVGVNINVGFAAGPLPFGATHHLPHKHGPNTRLARRRAALAKSPESSIGFEIKRMCLD